MVPLDDMLWLLDPTVSGDKSPVPMHFSCLYYLILHYWGNIIIVSPLLNSKPAVLVASTLRGGIALASYKNSSSNTRKRSSSTPWRLGASLQHQAQPQHSQQQQYLVAYWGGGLRWGRSGLDYFPTTKPQTLKQLQLQLPLLVPG